MVENDMNIGTMLSMIGLESELSSQILVRKVENRYTNGMTELSDIGQATTCVHCR